MSDTEASEDGHYRHILYSTHHEGTIARIELNRPRDSQRAAPPPAGGARRRLRTGPRRDDTVRVVILSGVGPDVLVGSRHGLDRAPRRAGPRAPPARDSPYQRRIPQGRRGADAAGVALLLREHPALALPPEDHDRPGARPRLRGRPHADVGVRPHRRRRPARPSPTSSEPGSGCAASSTSGIPGSSGPGRRRSCFSRAIRSTAEDAYQLGMVSKIFPLDQIAELTEEWALRIAQVPDDDGAARQGVGQPDGRHHGLHQRAERLLLPAPDQPRPLDVPQPRRHTGGDTAIRRPELA